MAETAASLKANYPLPVYNFRVTIDGEAISFAEVSGIAVDYETVTYRHGLSFWEGEKISKYRYPKYVPVTLRKGTVHGMTSLYDWLTKRQPEAKPIEISLCDETGTPLVTWQIAKAIPTKLQAPTFDANSNDVSVESLELMAGGFTLVHH